MGILKWLKERRTVIDVNSDVFWHSLFGRLGITTASGEFITPENSMQVSTVYACVRVLSESIAGLPLDVFKRRSDGGKDPATDHPLYNVLKHQPNKFQTAYEFYELMQGHKSLRGNAYAFKNFNRDGIVESLIPLDPSKMTVERKRGKTLYKYITEQNKQVTFGSRSIWHWKGISQEGIMGLSPVGLARESIALSKSAESHGGKFFANDARPSGILKTPGKLDPDAAKKMKQEWESLHTKDNAHKLAVMHGGLEWQSIGMSNEDSQFLETRSFQVEDIARIFRVPSLLINHPDKTATYASAEQFFLSFAVYTIRPLLVSIEQSMLNHLFTEDDRAIGYFPEFNINGLLRGDIKSRTEAYIRGRNWGWLSANDIRKLENMNPVENGDIYLQPLNMVEAGTPPPEPVTPGSVEEDADEIIKKGAGNNGK